MKRIIFVISLGVSALSLGAIIVWQLFLGFTENPSAVTISARKVTVAPDITRAGLINLLTNEGLIKERFLLNAYLKYFRKNGNFTPGEYELSGLMTPSQIVDAIQSGKVVKYALAIESGLTTAELAKVIEEKGFGSASQIKVAASNAAFAQALNIPGGRLEGYLLPGTYELPRKLQAEALLKIFVTRFRENVTDEIFAEAQEAGLSPSELVVLASIIASENVPPEELRMVSSVFHNRLKAGMKLQHAKSLAYGLEKKVDELSAEDQAVDNDWNTYLRSGLPSSPIASPDLKTILAAARPAKSDALFFAPRNESSHIFCPDAECHEIAMRRWEETQKGSDKLKQ
ncbi:MAG: endolytic transglycosylase MltG [Myxococcota bacterium]|nr:endolytic transglycosylase MltG [Myxococcota bacterium]